MNKNTTPHTVSAAVELHKIPGFDPLKHLRKSVNAQGEPIMGLEPRYQRLWFRLAYPKGRMLLNPLRLTDQLAIFEAKVFFHRDDPAPASSFTSSKSACEAPDYIRAAQDEALKEALDNAGFGIQLCDVALAPDIEGHIAPDPLVQVSHTEPAPVKPAQTSAPVEPVSAKDAPSAASVTKHVQVSKSGLAETPAVEEPVPTSVTIVQSVTEEHSFTSMEEAVSVQTKQPDVTQNDTAASVDHLDAVLNFPGQSAKNVPSPEGPAAEPEDRAALAYTEDMPVDKICKLMSLEQARSVIVTKGTCNGWTMGQVLEKRPSSLKFYLSGFGQCSNVQMAAATLLVQNMEQQKAS